MKKFYRELPEIITDILIISEGWLVGSSIEQLINNKEVIDYDIIVPKEKYRTIFRYVNSDKPEFNNHGGIKVSINNISIDIWVDSLDSYLTTSLNTTYVYNAFKNILLKNEK